MSNPDDPRVDPSEQRGGSTPGDAEARRKGECDIEAIKELSPNQFKDRPVAEHEAIARNLAQSLGMLRDGAYNRVVNQHPDGAKMQQLLKDLETYPPSDHPTVIFAHNLDTVAAIEAQLKAKGHRVGVVRGDMPGAAKEAARRGFAPPYDEAAGKYVSDPTVDVLVCSDAGAVGANLQRGSHTIDFDTPYTAMLEAQRLGRTLRTGQRAAEIRRSQYVTDTPYERSRRRIVAKKQTLRETVTTPALENAKVPAEA